MIPTRLPVANGLAERVARLIGGRSIPLPAWWRIAMTQTSDAKAAQTALDESGVVELMDLGENKRVRVRQ